MNICVECKYLDRKIIVDRICLIPNDREGEITYSRCENKNPDGKCKDYETKEPKP